MDALLTLLDWLGALPSYLCSPSCDGPIRLGAVRRVKGAKFMLGLSFRMSCVLMYRRFQRLINGSGWMGVYSGHRLG